MKGEVNIYEEPQGELDDPAEEEFTYDPQRMLQETGKVQNTIVKAIGKMDIETLVKTPSALESVSSFLNGVNNTAVQVTRNNIVGSALDVGGVADEVIRRMKEEKMTGIKTVKETGRQREIPMNVQIEDAEDLAFEDKMLERGIVTQTFDEFAEVHNIHTGN